MSLFIPLSSPIFWNSNHLAAIPLKDLHIFFHPSYKIHLYIQQHNTHITIYHNPLPIFPTLHYSKTSSFFYSKHISISFFIFHTKSPFLDSNIINVMTQKTTSAAALAIFNLHIIHLTLPYIFPYTFPTKYLYIPLMHL